MSEFDLTKVESVFGVITNDKDCHIVTTALGLSPSRFRQKGDESYSRFSADPIIARYGIWEISKTTVGENPDLTGHIEHYKRLLSEKLEAIENLRKQHKFVCVFYVLVTTEDTVGGFELDQEDLTFISRISDRFTLRFAANLEEAHFTRPYSRDAGEKTSFSPRTR